MDTTDINVWWLLLCFAAGVVLCMFAAYAGLFPKLKPENVHSQGWLWKDSEPAKFYGNLFITICGSLLIAWMIRRGDQQILDVAGRREYSTNLFNYRKEQFDRFSRNVIPAITTRYRTNALRIWLAENYATRDTAMRVNVPYEEVYKRWDYMQQVVEGQDDPEGACATLEGLARTEEARIKLRELRKYISDMANDDIDQNKLNELVELADKRSQEVLLLVSDEVREDAITLEKFSRGGH